MKRTALYLTVALAPFQLYAEAPNVVTDILPAHSLVSQVMEGVGTPDVLVPSNASPHGFSLRVSQASALENAGLVVWVGKDLTPWLDEALGAIAGDAHTLSLMGVDDVVLLAARSDHDHDHDGHDDHDAHDDHDDHQAHDDHADHDHDDHTDKDEDHADHDGHDDHAHKDEDHADHDDHAGHDDHEDHHDHAHGGDGNDPHMWLDPINAKAIVAAVADELAEIDPDNAETYRANAARAAKDLNVLSAEIAVTLAPVAETPFMVLHDAYQYFDARYGLRYEGAVLDLSGASPGPKGLADTKAHLEETGIACIFTEPQLSSNLIDTSTEDASVKSVEIDPLGADLEPGPALYGDMMRALAADMKACLE